jgi:hypothetical protein
VCQHGFYFGGNPCAASVENVVDDEQVGNVISVAIVNDVVGKVAKIDYVYLLE